MESAFKKISRFWPLVATTALLLVLLAQPAPAATKNWVGPQGNTLWTNANNWGLAPGEPVTGDAAILTSTTNKTATYDTTLNPSLIALNIDASGGSTFTLMQSANTLKASIENIGISGKGQVVQTGGTNTNSAFRLGNNPGSTGTYTLTGGNLSTSSDQIIGLLGTGLFNQTGGSNTVNSILYLGFNSTGNGAYTLQGGSLTSDRQVIGDDGTGTFNQTGGANTVNGGVGLSLGENVGSIGTYNLNGGHLQATKESIGKVGTGTVNQLTNSTNIVSGQLVLGDFLVGPNQGTGTYNMKGGYLQTLEEVVGDMGKGAFTQSGGTNLIDVSLILGNASTGSGSFTLQAGSLSSFNAFIGGSGVGQFTQSGGTHTVANGFTLGVYSGGSGAYTLNAGLLQAKVELIGDDGTGTFTQTGGTNKVGQFLFLGNSATGIGTYNLKNGTLSVAVDETVGGGGIGIFNQTGGTHTVTHTLYVNDSGTYNLQGGTLSAGTPFVGVQDIQIGGKFNVKNTTTTVTGDVTNLGTVKTTNANVTWNGNFGNAGAYISDPSTQTFNRDLTVLSTGYLVGGSQDVFIIKGDFDNQSIEKFQWNTVLSTLKFATGADNIHTMMVPGEDNGAHGQANNFTWGTLNITGQKLILDDPYTADSTAFYAEAVIGATFSGLTLTNITNLDSDPINIYYNVHLAANAYLHGLTYNIPGGGQLIAHAPVPPSVLLLGSGLLGLGALGWRRRKKD